VREGGVVKMGAKGGSAQARRELMIGAARVISLSGWAVETRLRGLHWARAERRARISAKLR
jgi:hypothetical protein